MGLKIESVLVESLSFDPNNARKHSEENLQAIAGSLDQFGQRKPIVVTADNVVVAGNGTLEAARSLRWSKIDVVRVPADWSADEVKAFALADNRTAELAEWDIGILSEQLGELEIAGWDLSEIGFEKIEVSSVEDLENAFDALTKDKGDIEQITFTLHRDQAETVRQAVEEAKSLGDFVDTQNPNKNGNAIARVAEMFLGSLV
jgi:ParB-like chromosome segregation protein Spo0J